ncbi:MAG TPA: hypothetical protein VF968_02620 [Actinomycetota bacterium]
MKTSRTQALFGTPTRLRDVAPQAKKGRPCSELGCSTLLSTYNTSDTCWLHTTPSTRHPLAHD